MDSSFDHTFDNCFDNSSNGLGMSLDLDLNLDIDLGLPNDAFNTPPRNATQPLAVSPGFPHGPHIVQSTKVKRSPLMTNVRVTGGFVPVSPPSAGKSTVYTFGPGAGTFTVKRMESRATIESPLPEFTPFTNNDHPHEDVHTRALAAAEAAAREVYSQQEQESESKYPRAVDELHNYTLCESDMDLSPSPQGNTFVSGMFNPKWQAGYGVKELTSGSVSNPLPTTERKPKHKTKATVNVNAKRKGHRGPIPGQKRGPYNVRKPCKIRLKREARQRERDERAKKQMKVMRGGVIRGTRGRTYDIDAATQFKCERIAQAALAAHSKRGY